MVFMLRKSAVDKFQQVFLGFAAGVMIAAAIWCLLIPAIEEAEAQGWPGWIPSAGGFVFGVLFLLGLDMFIPHAHPEPKAHDGLPNTSMRSTLLVSAVTIHNIPEGMAVGLSFALASQQNDPAMYAGAAALALGIGIQNFPEGAAVAFALRLNGASAGKAFGLACLSGAVEPAFGALAVIFAARMAPVMPWFLAFAAGAMVYVVVDEIIPEARSGDRSHAGILSVMAGFVLMMVLDVALE